MDCLFCKIANKEVEANIVMENDFVAAFPDIHPKAPTHILIVPKEHIESVKELSSGNIAGELILAARDIAKTKNLDGYKLLFNVGRAGGQEVDHLHLHLMGGN